MKRMRILGLALVAALAVAALAAIPASAAKVPLTLKTAAKPGGLVAGEKINGSAPGLLFTTSAGKLECSTNIIEGEVETNGLPTDTGKVLSSLDFGPEELETVHELGGHPKKWSNLCKTTTPFGPTAIEVKGTPWALSLSGKGKATITGTIAFKSYFPGVEIEFPESSGNWIPGFCSYSSSKIKLVNTKPAGGALSIAVPAGKFKRVAAESLPQCPKKGVLNTPNAGEYNVTAGAEQVEV